MRRQGGRSGARSLFYNGLLLARLDLESTLLYGLEGIRPKVFGVGVHLHMMLHSPVSLQGALDGIRRPQDRAAPLLMLHVLQSVCPLYMVVAPPLLCGIT